MKFTQKAVRRWCAAALALLLTFTLALPAMVATAEAGDDLTITIKNNEGLPKMTPGQFKAYQLFKGTPHKEDKMFGHEDELEKWQKPNDWGTEGTNWDNYTLADIEWGDDVKPEELVRALYTLSAEKDKANWPEFFTTDDEGGANIFTVIAKFSDPLTQTFDDGVLAAAALELAKVLESHNTNSFLQDFARFVTMGKDGDGNGYLQNGTSSTLEGGEDEIATNDVSKIDLSGDGTGKGPGYYLIVDEGEHNEQVDGATSEYILTVLASQTIQLKASVPTVDKDIVKPNDESGYDDVKGDAAGISDTVTFKLTGTLPKNFNDYDTYFYEFNDTLSKGLEFDKIETVTITLTNSKGEKETYLISAADAATTGYTLSEPVEPDEDGKTVFSVKFDDLMKLKGTKQSAEEASPSVEIPWEEVTVANMPNVTIEVTYSATVTEDAVIGSQGNPNDVYLTYSNDPNSDEQGKTHEVEVKVYVFGLDLTKKAGDTMNGLGGASFVLTKKGADGKTLYAKFEEDSTSEATTPKAKKLVQWDDETTYNASESKESNYYLTSVEETGKLPNVVGLDADTYTLVETVTPSGYNTMDPFTFTITAEFSEAGQLTKVIYTHTGEDPIEYTTSSPDAGTVFHSGLLPDDLINQKAPFLPFTGGMGITLIYLAGTLLIAGAAMTVAVVLRKRSKTHA